MHFCNWAKDFTNETSNTFVFGSENILNMENIWLLVDPNDKRNLTF